MLLFMPYGAIVPLEWCLLTSVIGLAVNMILLEAGICRTQEVLSGWELSIALTRCRFQPITDYLRSACPCYALQRNVS